MNITYHKLDIKERAALVASLTEYLKDDANISFAFLFGSFKDYDDAVGFRDIDVAVYITGVNDVLDYALNIATRLCFKHNLSVECIPLNIVPLFLKYRIFKDGTILFCKDENLMTDIMEETANNALDFMLLREEAIRELV